MAVIAKVLYGIGLGFAIGGPSLWRPQTLENGRLNGLCVFVCVYHPYIYIYQQIYIMAVSTCREPDG